MRFTIYFYPNFQKKEKMMPVRITSRESYDKIKESGAKYTQERKILCCVAGSPDPMSLMEIAHITGFDINAVSGRVNSLKKKRLLFEASKRKCTLTKRTIIPVIDNRSFLLS